MKISEPVINKLNENTSQIRIIIVDKEQSSILEIEHYLTENGIFVKSCGSPQEAIQLLNSEKYDWLITGLNMPGINGFELLLWVRENHPKIKVILISKFDNKELANFASRHGAIRYFPKPIDLKKLKELINDESMKNGFEGSIYKIDILSLLESVLLSHKKLIITVSCPDTGVKGKIFINEGMITHTEFGTLTDYDAFYKMIYLKKGLINVLPWTDPHIKNMSINATTLMNLIHEVQAQKEINRYNKKLKIMLVDNNKDYSHELVNILTDKGFDIVSYLTGMEAAKVLNKEFFDFIIVDMDLPMISGLDLLIWINENSPKTQVIITASPDKNPELEFFAEHKGAIKYLIKPVEPEILENYFNTSLLNSGFYGMIKFLTLIDLLKMIVLAKETRIISIEDYINGSNGLIYIKDGAVVHAETGDLIGDVAFFTLITMNNGIFFDIPWIEPTLKTIDKNFWELVNKLEKENKNFDSNRFSLLIDQEIKTLFEDKAEKNPDSKESKAMIKYTERILEQAKALIEFEKNNTNHDDIVIDESGVIFGLIIGKSHKNEVIEKMKEYSPIGNLEHYNDKMFFYPDLSCIIIFDEADIVEEISFQKGFKGRLKRGLKIGDTMQKGIEIYGPPKVCTIKGCIWDYFSIYSEKGKIITSIRLRNTIPFENRFSKVAPVSGYRNNSPQGGAPVSEYRNS